MVQRNLKAHRLPYSILGLAAKLRELVNQINKQGWTVNLQAIDLLSCENCFSFFVANSMFKASKFIEPNAPLEL